MITISFENRGNCGLCEYLYNSLKNQIVCGSLKSNEKLPSKRTLAENLGISVITVQNAYAQLISEGYIYSIEKRGFFVTDLKPFDGASENSTYIKNKNPEDSARKVTQKTETTEWFADFRSNSTSYEKFPFNLWSHKMRQILNSGDEKLLSRVGVKGILELRQAVSKYLKEFRNMHVNPEQIVIGAGTENLYSMIVQFLGRQNLFAVENTVFLAEIVKEVPNGIKAAFGECNFRQLVGVCPCADIREPAVGLDHIGNFRKKFRINSRKLGELICVKTVDLEIWERLELLQSVLDGFNAEFV